MKRNYLREEFEKFIVNIELSPIVISDDCFEIRDDSLGLHVFGPTPEDCVGNAKNSLFAKYEASRISAALSENKS